MPRYASPDYDPMMDELPPELAAQYKAEQRKQRIAQVMSDRALQPLQAPEVKGRFQGAISPVAGLAQLAQAYMSSKMADNADKGIADIGRQNAEGKNAAMAKMTQAMMGRPDEVMPAGVSGPPQPGSPGGSDAAIQAGLSSPYTQKMAQAILTQKLAQDAKHDQVVVPAGATLWRNGQAAYTAPEKTQYESMSNEEKLVRSTLLSKGLQEGTPEWNAAAAPLFNKLMDKRTFINMPAAPNPAPIRVDDGDGNVSLYDHKGNLIKDLGAVGKISKEGSLGLTGGRESVQNQRVMLAANQVAKDAENIARMPLSADRGIFGGRKQEGSLLAAGKETLATEMTTQDVQSYNVKVAGIQRNLAAIEAAGLMPSGALTHQMDAVIAKSGDTNFTKMQKLAQIRQIAEAGLETLASNPRISAEQKDHMGKVLKSLTTAVPFSHEQLDSLSAAQRTNPNATLASVKKALEAKAPATPAPQGVDPKVWNAMTPEEKKLWQN